MARVRIQSTTYLLPIEGFSQAVYAAHDGTPLFVSGLTARASDGSICAVGDAAEQTRIILRSLREILLTAGGDIDDVVRTVTYLTSMDDYDAVHAVRLEVFGKVQPASTTIQVSRLYDERQLLEIEATAVIAPPRKIGP